MAPDLSKRELLPQGARSLATICVTGIETEKGKNQADRQTDRKTRRQAKCVVMSVCVFEKVCVSGGEGSEVRLNEAYQSLKGRRKGDEIII